MSTSICPSTGIAPSRERLVSPRARTAHIVNCVDPVDTLIDHRPAAPCLDTLDLAAAVVRVLLILNISAAVIALAAHPWGPSERGRRHMPADTSSPGTTRAATPEPTASPARFHFDARARIVLHLGAGIHFVILESERVTSVHESDEHGEIRTDWFGTVAEATFDEALRAFVRQRDLMLEVLLAAVTPIRTTQLQPSAVSAGPAAPLAPPGPALCMGGSSLVSSPRTDAELRLVHPPEASVRPTSDEPPATTSNDADAGSATTRLTLRRLVPHSHEGVS